MARRRYSIATMIAAIRAEHGMVTRVADHLGCDPDTVRNYARDYPAISEALAEERERMTDLAECAMHKAISNGEPWAVALYLKTQGKHRGYVERQEVAGVENAPLTFTIQIAGRDDSDDE